jgi:catechol 2,3-dioxygenase-like lactoylglutathione lyase family enzyme
MDMKLEVMVVPVSDVERAAAFYTKLGWRQDADLKGEDDFRLMQFTPPGSTASVFIGHGVTDAEPGSLKGQILVVADIQAAYRELIDKGIEAAPVFHGQGWLSYFLDKSKVEPGPGPESQSYSSFTAFSDPDGNGWIVQEITQRLPGR